MALDVTILIFVSFWSLCASRECSDTWILGATLDTSATQENKANLSFTRIYLAKNTTQCANDCCLQLHGSCDLAVFTEKNNKGMCYHYQCSPIEHCRFKRDNDSEVYLVSISATENQSLSYLDDTTTPPKEELESTHGDGTKSKARKGALPDAFPPEDAPLKHDNTTIVPRKGVPVALRYDNPSPFNGNGSSPFLEGQDSAFNFTKENKIGNKMQFYVEEYNKDLENVTTSSNLSSNVDFTINSTEGDLFIPKSTPSAKPEKTLSLSETFPMTSTTVVPKLSASGTKVESHDEPTGSQLIEFHTEPVVTETTESLNPVPHGLTTEIEHIHASGSVVQVFRPSDQFDTDELFKTNGSMHLVIGLVIGLLVLLLVFGIVAKRIHDSWLRRHYHRMDFLIDGMYHGDP